MEGYISVIPDPDDRAQLLETRSREFTKSTMKSNDETRLSFSVGWNRVLLNMLGIWPGGEEVQKSSFPLLKYRILLVALFVALLMCLPQTLFLVVFKANMDDIVDNLALCNVTATATLMKMLVFWYKQEDLKILLGMIFEDWTEVEEGRPLELMQRNAELGRMVLRWIAILTYIMQSFFFSQHVYLQMIRKSADLETHRELIILSYFPFDFQASPIFELVSFGQYLALFFAATAYMATDSFIMMLVSHVCVQLVNLKSDLKSLAESKDCSKRIIAIVRKHERIVRFSKKIEDSFNLMFLVQMLVCIVQLCLQGFQLLMSLTNSGSTMPLPKIVVYMLFCIFIFSLLGVYCYVGEELEKESTALTFGAYDSAWYELTPYQAKTLILIMVRSNTPLCITAGRFCSLNMATFSAILKTSMSYISVLMAAKTSDK